MDFTFLEKDKIIGDNQIELFKKYGAKSFITDFSLLIGGPSDIKYDINEKKYSSWYWTTTSYGDKYEDSYLYIIDEEGLEICRSTTSRSVGARPVVGSSNIIKKGNNLKRNEKDILEIEYGYYPQTIVDEKLSTELEKLYQTQNIKETGDCYTTDSVYWKLGKCHLRAKEHIEYEYKNERYIRCVTNQIDKEVSLPDGRKIKDNSIYWVKVEPIKWLIDEKENIAISEKIIFSGIQYDGEIMYVVDYDESNIKWFMNEYFSKDIIPNKTIRKIKHGETTEQRKGIKIKKINLEKMKDMATNQEKTNKVKVKARR